MNQKYTIILSRRDLILLSLIYLLSFAAAELINYHISPVLGIVVYFAILFSLIINGAFSRDQNQRGLWIGLGLAPLIRIVSLAMPFMLTISQYLWYVIISIPIMVGIFTVARALKFSPDAIGLNLNDPVAQVLTGSAGIGMAAVGYLVLRTAPWIDVVTVQTTLFPALILIIFTGLIEELAFRGVMQRAAGVLGSYGWVYIAAVYAVIQIGQGSILHFAYTFAASLFFGWVVKATGSITGVGIAHGLVNIGLYLAIPHIL